MDWLYLKELLRGILYNSKNIMQSIPTYLGIFAFFIIWLFSKKKGNKIKSKLLLKARKHAFIICTGFILISLILTSHELYKNKPVKTVINLATPEALISPVLRNMDFRIADLVREDFVIRNRTIENCHIYGPAVIYAKKDTIIGNILFADVTQESGLIVTTNQKLAGIIVLEGCIITNCTFHKISFIGPENEIQWFRDAIENK